MPLIKSKTNKAREKNIDKEIAAGKNPKQAVAIGYSEQRRARRGTSEGFMPRRKEPVKKTRNAQ